MIVCQLVLIEWNKKSRAAEYTAIRRKLPREYELPPKFFSNGCRNHSFYIWQMGEQLKKRESFDFSLAARGVEISEKDSGVDVYFNYTPSIGAPMRTYKHAIRPIESNNTEYLHSTLREKAFTLTEGRPYGRMIYNGRLNDYDTGQWYYREFTVNIFYVTAKFDKDLFINQKPNFVYEQRECLF